MQVSLNWLNEFVDLSDLDVKQIAYELTMSGLEVEEIEEIKPKFTNIKTVRIEKIAAHPNSDRLHLVTVSGGKTVVCGAQNLAEGRIVPYASVGSQVLDRKTGELFTLTPAIIRGVESQGMLCSADELGVAERGYQDEDGILILDRFLPAVDVGQDLEGLLGFDEDYILHVAPTANRGDQMSVIGVARELSAIFNRQAEPASITLNSTLKNTGFRVEILDSDVCKYYSLGILKNIRIKPSPDWMQKRLVASGIRAINNVVDITNYVLMEYGVPLHAFDLDKLNGYLCVRRAKEGEKITTLDSVERTLCPDTVLIATKEQGVCLAGVFGGENSEVDANTTALALEAAYFTPIANRKSARSVGYRSEACARFERGVDIEALKPALLRAMQLLVELADAKIESIVEAGSNVLEPAEVTFRYAQVKRILGVQIASERCDNILERLGFEKLGGNAAAAKFKVPSWRAGDAEREIDLIEEVARINGYDKIAPTLPGSTAIAQISHEERVLTAVRESLSASGLDEIQTSSLIGKALPDKFGINYDATRAVELRNSASEDYSMLRQSLAASVLNCLKYNFDNGQKNFWAYEIGKTYFKTREAGEKDTGIDENLVLAGVFTGEIANSKWQDKAQTDFYTLKGVFEKLFEELGLSKRIKLSTLNSQPSTLHPYRSAGVSILGQKPEIIGYFGQIHPLLKDKMKLNQDAFLFEIDLNALICAVKETVPRFKKLPQFPEVRRDIAFIINDGISYEDIQKTVKSAVDQKLFQGSEIFDLYQGAHVEKGFKSLAFRIKLRDDDATLTDEIIEGQMKNVREKLQRVYAEISFRE